jgi:hypothetical protein
MSNMAVSYKRQELPTLSKHLSLPPVFCQFVLFIYFSFLCCIFALIVFVLRLVYPMLPVALDRPFLIVPSVSLTFIYCNIILHFLILHSYYVVFVCL